jgi:hypothetical protein
MLLAFDMTAWKVGVHALEEPVTPFETADEVEVELKVERDPFALLARIPLFE